MFLPALTLICSGSLFFGEVHPPVDRYTAFADLTLRADASGELRSQFGRGGFERTGTRSLPSTPQPFVADESGTYVTQFPVNEAESMLSLTTEYDYAGLLTALHAGVSPLFTFRSFTPPDEHSTLELRCHRRP